MVVKMDKRTARAERSKAAMKDAFLDLLQTMEPEEISVATLCRKAGRNRSTFYAHYDYIDMMIQEILRENLENIYTNIESQWSLPLENGGIVRTVITEYINRFLDNTVLRRFCTCENSGKYITLITQLQVDITLGPTKDPVKYYYAFFHNAGVLNLVLEWLRSGRSIPEGNVVEIVHDFSKVLYSVR